jgi:methionine sulfoxide reductase heme-binding subunit
LIVLLRASIAALMRTILNNRLAFWLLLSIPALLMLTGWWQGRIDSMDMLHPTGEWSARLMIFAMMIGPLVSVFGSRPWLNWLVARRRYLGVGAFLYAVLHLIFYIIDMGNVDDMLAEFLAPGIWTGWAALAIMTPLVVTSNDVAMRAMKAGWKKLQRLVYLAALLTLLHWMWVHNSYTGALVHFAPLAVLWIARFAKTIFQHSPQVKGA